MRKTNLRISLDLNQELSRIASYISDEKLMKIDKDSALRYVLNFFDDNHQEKDIFNKIKKGVKS